MHVYEFDDGEKWPTQLSSTQQRNVWDFVECLTDHFDRSANMAAAICKHKPKIGIVCVCMRWVV